MASTHERAGPGEDELDALRAAVIELASSKTTRYAELVEIDGHVDYALAIVLGEINQTVLPRLITLECHPVGTVRLKVTHRRLFEFQASDNKVTSACDYSGDLDTFARDFVAAMRSTFSRSQTLCIEPPLAINDVGDTSMSCSTQLLRDIAAVHEPPKTYDSLVVDYIGWLKSISNAWRLRSLSEEGVEEHGSADDLRFLESLHHALFSENEADGCDHFAKDKGAIFVCPLEDGTVIVTARHATWQFAALTREDVTDRLGTGGPPAPETA